MLNGWGAQKRLCFAHMRVFLPPPAAIFQLPDGSFTAKFSHIHERILEVWKPIFCRYATSPEPAWAPFHTRFGSYIKHNPMLLEPLTGPRLHKRAMAIKR